MEVQAGAEDQLYVCALLAERGAPAGRGVPASTLLTGGADTLTVRPAPRLLPGIQTKSGT